MINKPEFFIIQIRAVTEFAISCHREEALRDLLDELLASCSRIEHAIAWQKIHGGDAA
jgi:hypothetical protein